MAPCGLTDPVVFTTLLMTPNLWVFLETALFFGFLFFSFFQISFLYFFLFQMDVIFHQAVQAATQMERDMLKLHHVDET